MKRSTALFLSATFAFSFMSSLVSAQRLIYCSEASPEGFDVALYAAGTTLDAASRPLLNRLVEFESGKTSIGPGLAEKWDVSEDSMEYTFYLRKDVKFHTTKYFKPTRVFNADDVIFSFERQRDKSHPWYSYLPGASYEYFNSMGMDTLVKEIVKVDDYTVKFVLSRPEAPFLANIAMDFASIFSKEYADQLQKNNKMEQLNQFPVGTGPFIFESYKKDAVIRYKANDDYFRNKQKIKNLIFSITKDASVRVQKLKKGECDVMPYPNPSDVASLKEDPKLQVLEGAGLNIAYIAFNTQKAPFDKPEVRRALNMAVDKKAIVEAVFEGGGQVAKNPIPPTMWSYNDDLPEDKYDPEGAKALLEKAGIKDLKVELWAMPVNRPYMPNARRTAEMIQADFAKIGVSTEILSFEWGEYLKRSSDTKRDAVVILGWNGDNGDPDNFLGVLLGCSGVGGANRAQWCYKPFDDILQKARTTSHIEERTKLYREAQEIFRDQAPWIVLAHSTVYMPMSIKVKNYKLDPFSKHMFEDVDISK